MYPSPFTLFLLQDICSVLMTNGQLQASDVRSLEKSVWFLPSLIGALPNRLRVGILIGLREHSYPSLHVDGILHELALYLPRYLGASMYSQEADVYARWRLACL